MVNLAGVDSLMATMFWATHRYSPPSSCWTSVIIRLPPSTIRILKKRQTYILVHCAVRKTERNVYVINTHYRSEGKSKQLKKLYDNKRK